MDNLGAHKVSGVRQAIDEAVGARLLYLPPYSPDLNPIEKCWSKIKKLLRDATRRGGADAPGAGASDRRRLRHRNPIGSAQLVPSLRLCVVIATVMWSPL